MLLTVFILQLANALFFAAFLNHLSLSQHDPLSSLCGTDHFFSLFLAFLYIKLISYL